MIKEIRDHIVSQIKKAESKYKQTDNPFFSDAEVSGTKVDYTYSVEFGAYSQTLSNDGEAYGSQAVTVKTYRQGTRDKLKDHDIGLCEAIVINNLLLDRIAFNNAKYIKEVQGQDVTPSLVDDSQNIYVYTNNLTFFIGFGIGE
jgi:hypothetical protein